MDILEAKEKSLKLWQWLVEHPLSSKEEAYDTLRLAPDISDCPLCQYATEQAGESPVCDHCPVDQWRLSLNSVTCIYPTEPYAKWRDACEMGDKEEATQAANAMVELIKQIKVD